MLINCKISGFSDEIGSNVDRQLALLKNLGTGYVEFRSGDGKNISDYTLEEVLVLKKRLDEAVIAVSAVASSIGKIGIEENFEPHFEKFKHMVKVAGLLNSPYIRVFSFYLPEKSNPAQFREKVMERMKALVDYAAEKNVVLLHENEKGIYGENAVFCYDLFKTISSEYFRCTFDFANFVQSGQDTLEAYEILEPYITYIHVKDALWDDGKIVLAGKGDGHIEEILKRLDKRSFTGFLSLEPHVAGLEAPKSLQYEGDETTEQIRREYAWRAAHRSLIELLAT